MKTSLRKTRALTRHFISEFFVNDFIQAEQQMQEKAITLLVMLAIVSGFIAHRLLLPYLADPRAVILGRSWVNGRVWMEKAFFLTIAMGVTGIVTVLQWDRLFLSERDFQNLAPLPVKGKIIFSAKWVSIGIFIVLVTAAVNFFSIGVHALYLSGPMKLNPFLLVAIFLFCNFLAGFFTFSLVALLHGLIMAFTRPDLQKRISVYVQIVLLVGFIMLLLWFPGYYSSLPAHKEAFSTFFWLFPPLWFSGLSEVLTGNTGFEAQAWFVLPAVVFPGALYYLLFSLAYRRSMCNQGRSTGIRPKRKRNANGLKTWFRSVFLPSPLEKAIFHFIGASLQKSRHHKLRLWIYLSIPAAYTIMEWLVQALKKNYSFFKVPNEKMMLISLVFGLALVMGMRQAVSIPVHLSANWIFRLTEKAQKQPIRTAIRKALWFHVLLPFFLIMSMAFTLFWGFGTGLRHLLYQAFLVSLIMEVAFFNPRKIPFTCTYLPGKSRIRTFLGIYLWGFLIYVSLFILLEKSILHNTRLYFLVIAAFIFIHLGLKISRSMINRNQFDLVFEDNPDPAILTLGLDI